MQTPAAHASMLVHRLLSSQEAASWAGAVPQVPSAAWQTPLTQGPSRALQLVETPLVQNPFVHCSRVVQASSSEQVSPSRRGTRMHMPVKGAHVPDEQSLSKCVQSRGTPRQPPAVQASLTVQRFLSSHAVVFGATSKGLHCPLVHAGQGRVKQEGATQVVLTQVCSFLAVAIIFLTTELRDPDVK